MTGKINLLIFDLDGTLIDSKRDIATCVNLTLRDLHLPAVSEEVVYSYVGHGVRDLIEKSVGDGQGDRARFNEGLKIFKQYYLSHLLDETCPFPGIVDILRHFSDRKKAVLTNKPQEFTDPILKGLDLIKYFDLIVGAEAGFPKKPDPTAVIHIMENLQCPPDRTVLIGDSAVDIETGKNAGILTCGVFYGFRPAEEIRAAGPNYAAMRPDDIARLIS